MLGIERKHDFDQAFCILFKMQQKMQQKMDIYERPRVYD